MTEHAPAPLPRRRDIHHPDRTTSSAPASRRSRRRVVRAGVPVALTVMALTSPGVTQAVADTGSAAPATPEARSVSVVGTSAFGPLETNGVASAAIQRPSLSAAAAATSGAAGADTAAARDEQAARAAAEDARAAATPSGDEALTAAQEALARADHVTTESRGVPAKQRKAVARSAAHLREVVSDRSDAPAASRAGERAALDVRAEGATEVAAATADLTTLVEKTETSAISITPAPATPGEILDAQAAEARKAAASLKKFADDTEGYENGRIAAGDLSGLSFASGESLRRDAAEQLERLDAAYRARFGEHLQIRDSYRSYASQVAVKASRGYMAAVPGYSNHGWGVAVDINGGVEERSSAQHQWLVENAAKFGWHNPAWAQADGRKPEPWHWEYRPV
ncbi:D-alanyl-D-alanine carboxypeptidase family protein [Isoptericola sp. NPDC057391]|uniref:M15 family metallopeptidase n=1 Tax=Isoptericola sp. NPDC057391 TaxID=3346117 RepID=UPI0036345BFA